MPGVVYGLPCHTIEREVIKEILPPSLPGLILLFRDRRGGIPGITRILNQHKIPRIAIVLEMTNRRNARQQESHSVAHCNQAHQQKDALGRRSHRRRMRYGFSPQLPPQAQGILKGAEAEQRDLLLCGPQDAMRRGARLPDMPQFRSPLPPPFPAPTPRH